LPDARPLILAFDTSAAHCAAALLSGDELLQTLVEPMAKGQAERLVGLCQEILAAAGVGMRDLTSIGVGVGPGNFTGIRISVSAARGMALGLDIPAIGVSAFEALRFGTIGPCVCAVDARRDQIFVQGFENPTISEPLLMTFDALPTFQGPLIGAQGIAPRFPVAEAIARIAALHGGPATRPQPLYLRQADAAPARDAPPVIVQ